MRKDLLSASALLEKMAGLTAARKFLLFAATFFFLGGGFYFFLYQNQADEIVKLEKSIADQEKRLSTLKHAAARVDAMHKELAASEEEFGRLLALLPDQKEIPGLLESVSHLGSKVGLENILFQPQPELPHEFYATIPVRLDLVGSFSELGLFLDSVSRLDRILKVESLNMARQKEKGASRLQVGCTVVTYRFFDKPVEKSAPGKKK